MDIIVLGKMDDIVTTMSSGNPTCIMDDACVCQGVCGCKGFCGCQGVCGAKDTCLWKNGSN